MLFTCRFFILTALSLLLSACLSEPDPITPPKKLIRPVKIVTVGDQTQQNVRTFPATVEAVDEAQLAFRVSGQVINRPVKAGQKVQKGALIAALDPKDFKTQLSNKQASYNLAKAQYDRAAKVVKQGHVSKAEFDSRKAKMLEALASLKQAKNNLSYTKIFAPLAGEIAQVHVDKHEFVNVKQPVVTIQSSDKVYVTLQVPESIIATISNPETAKEVKSEVLFDSHPNERFFARFHELDKHADPATRTYKLRLILPHPKKFPVLAGMSARVMVNLSLLSGQTENQLTIPAACVFNAPEDAQQYVWVFAPDTQQVEKRAVTVGSITAAGIEILSGLTLGEQVVAAGVHHVRADMKVRPLSDERGL